MKKVFLIISVLISLLIVNTACNPDDVIESNNTDTNSTQTESASDYIWDNSNAETVTFNGTSISTTSSNVTITGSTAIITDSGNYIISGTLSNGQLKVNAPKAEIKIQLNNVTMSNATTSPFYIEKAGKVIIFLPSGTVNTLSDASSYSNSDEPSACIFSNSYLGFTGEGTLTIKGNYADGISSDDQIVINSGVFNVTAKDDGIRGKDYLVINNGTISSTSTSGHALKSDNTDTGYGFVQIKDGTLTLASNSGKGVKAVNKYIQNGGSITITKSYEGIESYNITVNSGYLDITATNDGVNATAGTVRGGTESNDGSSFNVTGGTIITTCSNGDAIDSNGNVTVSGGLIIANGPSSGVEEAVDVNGTFNMNGGTFIGCGSNSNMSKSMSTSSTQSNIYLKVSSGITSSTFIDIKIGTEDVLTFKPKSNAYIFLLSAPKMEKGASYSIYTGGSYSTNENTGGLYTGGTYTAGTSKKTGTLSSSSTVNTISF